MGQGVPGGSAAVLMGQSVTGGSASVDGSGCAWRVSIC